MLHTPTPLVEFFAPQRRCWIEGGQPRRAERGVGWQVAPVRVPATVPVSPGAQTLSTWVQWREYEL